MAPRQGMRAGVEHAARRELPAAEWTAMDCLGTPCGALQGPDGPAGNWSAREVSAASAAFRTTLAEGGPHPARVVDDLVAAMGEEADRAAPFNPGAPRFVFVVSSNVDGQDLATTALARDSLVFDDAIGAVWARWQQFSAAAAESALLHEPLHR